jgi:hypothetical protein
MTKPAQADVRKHAAIMLVLMASLLISITLSGWAGTMKCAALNRRMNAG